MFISTWPEGKNAGGADEHEENDETITREDLARVMEKIGIVWEQNEEEEKGQSLLGFGEISSLFNENEPSLEEIKEAFDLFDESKDGYIDAKELKKMLCALGNKETSELECEKMILAFDYNGDRLIDFGEFLRILEKSFC